MNSISAICPQTLRPSYSCNGVKIDIHNPQAGIPMPTPPVVVPQYASHTTVENANIGGVYNYPKGSLYAQNPMAYPIPCIASPNTQASVAPIAPAVVQASAVASNSAAVAPVATAPVTKSANAVANNIPHQVVKPVIVDDTASKIKPVEAQAATFIPPAPVVKEVVKVVKAAPTQIINNNVGAPVSKGAEKAVDKTLNKTVDKAVVANTVTANEKSNIAKTETKITQSAVNRQEAPKAKPTVDVKPSADMSAKLRGDFVARLKSNDVDTQTKALLEIANATQQLSDAKKAIATKAKTPEFKQLNAEYNKAFDALASVVLDEKVVEGILGTLVKDSSTLEGPTPKQIELRTKLMQGAKLTQPEMAEADTLSPMEKAEQNKEFALFTLRLIQEMYMEGIEKMTGKQPDLKDVPGVEQMIITIKSNPNPSIRAAAISAISHNPRQQDKEILNTVLKIASEQDEDKTVRDIAAQSMAKINPQPAQTKQTKQTK
ncbi:HEAT repeat domain-containing protein [bacterium]|nr:HEAT repeat domain-containing protein [bacterium]